MTSDVHKAEPWRSEEISDEERSTRKIRGNRKERRKRSDVRAGKKERENELGTLSGERRPEGRRRRDEAAS